MHPPRGRKSPPFRIGGGRGIVFVAGRASSRPARLHRATCPERHGIIEPRPTEPEASRAGGPSRPTPGLERVPVHAGVAGGNGKGPEGGLQSSQGETIERALALVKTAAGPTGRAQEPPQAVRPAIVRRQASGLLCGLAGPASGSAMFPMCFPTRTSTPADRQKS